MEEISIRVFQARDIATACALKSKPTPWSPAQATYAVRHEYVVITGDVQDIPHVSNATAAASRVRHFQDAGHNQSGVRRHRFSRALAWAQSHLGQLHQPLRF